MNRPASDRIFIALLLALVFIAVLWPGDISFVNDEPWLISHALHANESHRLADVGLPGSLGLRYGPLPVWIYQVLLLFSHDLCVIVALRALIVRAAIAASVCSLARTLKLNRWFVLLPLLSPYLWIYSRGLWDNTFCLPLGIGALAAYAALLERPTAARLATTLACIAGLILTHPMALVLVLPLLLHLVVWSHGALRRHWNVAATVLGLAALLPFQYWQYLASVPSPNSTGQIADPFHWFFALLGARLLTAGQLAPFFDDTWTGLRTSPLLALAQWMTLLAHAFFWIGLCRAADRAWRIRAAPSVLSHVCLISLAALMGQELLHGFGHLPNYPHYYNGAWAVDVVVTWLGIDLVARRSFGRAAVIAYAAAISVMLCAMVLHIHLTAGTRSEGYGPTLTTELQIVSRLTAYDPKSPVITTVPFLQRFPGSIDLLTQMQSPWPALRPNRPLLMRYTSDDPEDAHIEVIEQPERP